MVMLAERRRASRAAIDWPVSVYHPHLAMFINGRSVDVSRGGARIRLPIAVPVRPGQVLEVNFPRTATLAKVAGCFSRIKTARVVRVQAEPPGGGPGQVAKLPKATRQFIAVQFDQAAVHDTD